MPQDSVVANIYIDGFNLYYGALKGTGFKWLNLAGMCEQLLPGRSINKIRYFTAKVFPLPHNSEASVKQQLYLRALSTIPNLDIHYGRFAANPTTLPAYPVVYRVSGGLPEMARVLRTEEKRSDVNLATLLMLDCVDDSFDEAVVVSNDSDLALPIEVAASRFRKTVGVVNPQRKNRPSRELSNAASWVFRSINARVLAESQFPPEMVDARGPFFKPPSW